MREAVLRACLDLLVEGMVELPATEVAGRSGVNRATIYRWWPTPADLLADAVAFHWDHRIDPPDTGSWEGDVRAVVTEVAALVDEPVERAIMAAMATGRYPAFSAVVMGAWRKSLPQWTGMVQRAVDRGEVRPEVDPYSVVKILLAPLIATSLLGEGGTSPHELDQLIDLVCRATTARPG
ncbi:TetR-like C-terminal domain-containing protein [Yinghuangia sp. YIM S09857]|uniref:TetR-like C-terminal domain-containing protein n=1 Tax=Yinghuangia sp. YIM S09857 TaxID=3436929 RepID=UPI003F5390EB